MTTETVVQPSALDQAQANMIAALEKMIMFAVDSAEKAGEMLAEQVPDIVMQLLTWHAVKYGINAFIGAVLVVLAICLIVHMMRQIAILSPNDRNIETAKWKYSGYYGKWQTTDSWDILMSLKVVVATIFSIIGSVMLYKNLMLTLYIVVAPKVYLIEYGVDLVGKMSGN